MSTYHGVNVIVKTSPINRLQLYTCTMHENRLESATALSRAGKEVQK